MQLDSSMLCFHIFCGQNIKENLMFRSHKKFGTLSDYSEFVLIKIIIY